MSSELRPAGELDAALDDLVGEIRDQETAEIATHALLTGHLILSTLHTHDAATALTRFAVNAASKAAARFEPEHACSREPSPRSGRRQSPRY